MMVIIFLLIIFITKHYYFSLILYWLSKIFSYRIVVDNYEEKRIFHYPEVPEKSDKFILKN